MGGRMANGPSGLLLCCINGGTGGGGGGCVGSLTTSLMELDSS